MSVHLIAIGASTGGVAALEGLLSELPIGLPPIVIVQHILPSFGRAFAERLDAQGAIRVVEAGHGTPLTAGNAYLAPAHTHLKVASTQGELRAFLSTAPPVRFHRPSVDVLFYSIAELPRVRAVGVLLTGMGRDGADGMLALRRAGATTIAQDQASSVVFGMPKEAIASGAAKHVVPLQEIAGAIVAAVRDRGYVTNAAHSRNGPKPTDAQPPDNA